jgi:putative nucleotidyltransferase with HDIG domain
LIKSVHPVLKEIAAIFSGNGKQAYLVGGAVRDMLMGKKIHDWDIATDALPEEVTAIVKRAGGKVIPTGLKHGTVTVFYKRERAEVTTFRTESDYSDGRRPDKVEYAATIQEDLSRRDFTMNAIAMRLPKCEIIDPFDGKKDIKTKLIRCVGNAAERFNEDGLRPMRAVRFASQLGFTIEKTTLDAIPGALPVAAKVSQERVKDEFDKILASGIPSRAFRLMEQTGLLKLFFSELSTCRGIEQKGFHQFDVLDHCLLACDYAAANNYSHELRLAALLHDVGKPQSRKIDASGVWIFHRHEEESAKISSKMLRRLRYSNTTINSVCHLIYEHMFNYTEDWSDAAVRRFIARAGEVNIQDLYRLRRADAYAFAAREADPRLLSRLAARVTEALISSRAFTIKDLAITGNDLIESGIPPGKKMGVILNELLETVLDDPEQNTREILLNIARNLYER